MDRNDLPEFIDDEKLQLLFLDCRTKVYKIKDFIRMLIPKMQENNYLDEGALELGITVLYSHELEQLGKLICLRELKQEGKGEKGYPFRERLFPIWFQHNNKIQKALENLPPECGELWADFDNTNFSSDFMIESTSPDFMTRLRFLHTDIDKHGNVSIVPNINMEKLLVAVQRFDELEWQF